MKRFDSISSLLDTSLITSSVITGGIFIGAFSSSVRFSVGIGLRELVYFFLLQPQTHASYLQYLLWSKKNTTQLDYSPDASWIASLTVLHRQCMIKNNSSIDFYNILQKTEKYRKNQAVVRNCKKAA